MRKTEILALTEKVNNYWIQQMPNAGDCNWERAAYQIGNMAAYELTNNKGYLNYALNWAAENNWSFYDGRHFNHTFRNADFQLCAETYLSLIQAVPGVGTDEYILKDMQEILQEPDCDYWSWVDLIYMGLATYHKFANHYQDERYIDKAYALYKNIRDDRHCYDQQEHLWYRDQKFLPDVAREENGEKIFWGRGNGWVFAGLARGLALLPKNSQYYEAYVKDFQDMAKRLKDIMNEDGSYGVSFLDKETYPYHETSSTVLITLGYYIGVRLGILDQSYLETANKGFHWLTTVALEDSGRIGWAQDVAARPKHNVKKEISKDYVVGTFLLILKELYLQAED